MELPPNLYHVTTKAEKIKIVQSHGKTWDEFEEIVEDFKRWVEHSPFAKYRIAQPGSQTYFLLNCKLDVERAKKNLENYCRARASCAYFYEKLIPGTEYFETAAKFGKLVIMPKLTPNLDEVTIYKIDDIPGDAPDAVYYYVTTVMLAEMKSNRAFFASHIIIIDLSDFSLNCFVKYTPQITFTFMKIANSFNLRIKLIHIINAPEFMNKILNLIKYLITKKLFSRIKIHDTLATLREDIPEDCLPSDYGGSQPSFEEIYGDWIKVLHLHREEFEKTAQEEYPAEDKFLYSEIVEGAPSGTFKTLVVD